MAVPLSYYLILSGFVFLTGVVGVLIRRNIIVILLSVELMLNATNINFVAFSADLGDLAGAIDDGFGRLAIIIALHRSNSSIYVDDLNLLKR